MRRAIAVHEGVDMKKGSTASLEDEGAECLPMLHIDSGKLVTRGHQYSYRNVFGNPITDETLRGMPEYKDKPEITATERAKVALNMKNAGDKHVQAREFVEGLKDDYGGRQDFVESGHIGASPYPQQINNGQWGAYLHVHPKGDAVGSSAAVVDRGKNEGATTCNMALA